MPERMSVSAKTNGEWVALDRRHVLAPRLGDADDNLQRRIDLPGRFRQTVGQAEQLVLSQRQNGGGIAGRGQLPATDAMAVTPHRRFHEFAHEASHVRQIALPQPQPRR